MVRRRTLPVLEARHELPMKYAKPTNATLDEALHSLSDRSSADQRLAVLRQFVEYWHGSLRSGNGYTEEELHGTKLPMPLRWWFKIAGHRKSVISGQNFLQAPSDMTLDDECRLLFYIENQGVYSGRVLVVNHAGKQ
jgi:hypothetical protein